MPTSLLEELSVYPPTWLKLTEERNKDAQRLFPISPESITKFLYLEMHFLSYSLVIFGRLFNFHRLYFPFSKLEMVSLVHHSIIKRYISSYLELKFMAHLRGIYPHR